MSDLLKPRYEVISDFWDSPFKVGQIVNFNLYSDGIGYKTCIDGLTLRGLDDFEKYPHLFRKLSWWEHISLEQLPMYVKLEKKPDNGSYWEVGAIMKVKQWGILSKDAEQGMKKYNYSKWYCIIEPRHHYNAAELSPSNKTEYHQYIKQQS